MQGTDVPVDEAADGVVRLVWRRKLGLEWSVIPATVARSWHHADFENAEPRLGFEFADGTSYLPVHYYNDSRGWSNGGDIGDDDARLKRVVGHLINMPMIHGSQRVHDPSTHATWSGRWQFDAEDWLVTVNATRTHADDFRLAKDDETFALTHIVEVTRLDSAYFAPADASAALSAIHFALSFAAGYWVGLAGTTGVDDKGGPRWAQWRSPHVGRAQCGQGWWIDTRPNDLADCARGFLKQWDAADATDPLRFAVTSSILANDTGFVEQRLMSAIAALEFLSWTYEVIEHRVDERKWWKGGDRRLRRTLRRMSIEPDFGNSPGRARLSQYGRSHGYHDLAQTVFEVRNRVTHPKRDDNLYEYPGVLAEAWRHASFWLELAILHRIGFRGHVADRTVVGGWVGESNLPVPWAIDTDDE